MRLIFWQFFLYFQIYLFVHNQDMKRKVDKGLIYMYRKVVHISTIAVLLLLASCKKDEPPVVKSIEQSVVLNNYVEIKYSATLSNVDKAELKINKEGVLISTEEISVASTGTVYQKTYSYTVDPKITKGKYEFTLTSDNLEKKNSIEIPNYNPSINTFAINLDLNENQEINITLPPPVDKNPEDNPVPVIGVKSLDGKTQAILKTLSNGYDLDIKALSNQTGSYQLELDYGSTTGGFGQTVLQGQIMKDTRINPFVQPNDSTLNWYGSGDVNNDNIVNSQDLTRLNEIIAGTYSNPGDTRLMDRADVNGDGVVDSQDAQLLLNKLNGSIPYLPGEWNKLQTRAEREDWLKKMLVIDKTDEIAWSPSFDCTKFSFQTMINFHGSVNPTDISRIQEFYTFDLSNNGRFNIPMYGLQLVAYNLNGEPINAHSINAVFIGDGITWDDLIRIEPQDDSINYPIGQGFLSPFGTNSKFNIYGLPIQETCGINCINPTIYIIYTVENNIPTLVFTNPDLITQRGK